MFPCTKNLMIFFVSCIGKRGFPMSRIGNFGFLCIGFHNFLNLNRPEPNTLSDTMTLTRKVTGITMALAGFTFFAWFIALNTISPAIPAGLQGTANFFMILSALTGVGFLVSGGMTFFGHDQYAAQQNAILEKGLVEKEKNPGKPPAYKSLPAPTAHKAKTDKDTAEHDDVVVVEEEEKKKGGQDNRSGEGSWAAPSKTGWG